MGYIIEIDCDRILVEEFDTLDSDLSHFWDVVGWAALSFLAPHENFVDASLLRRFV